MGITVEAAATLAAVVSSAVVTTVAAGVGSTVAASVAGAGAGSAGGGAGASASGAGSGGAIMLLGQVQSMALTSQFNVDMPEAYSSFTGGFGWANLQLEILGRWEPAVPSHNATANATTSTGRRPEDERARSEECGTSEGGGTQPPPRATPPRRSGEMAPPPTSVACTHRPRGSSSTTWCASRVASVVRAVSGK